VSQFTEERAKQVRRGPEILTRTQLQREKQRVRQERAFRLTERIKEKGGGHSYSC